jgi:type IV secretion system protein VirB5
MFSRPVVRYGTTPSPETPYQRAQQTWDTRIGSARVQAKNWRLAFFATLLLCAGMAGGWYWQAARGTVIPWVVQVDRLGNVQAVGPATTNYQPTDPVIARDLAQFIEWVRGVSVDAIDMRRNWLRAYDFLTDHGKRALNNYAQNNDPFAKLGKEQISVEVVSVIRASDKSFRISWIERRYADGVLAATEHWSAIATIVVETPRDATKLKFNPLGIYIDAINWSKEIG